MRLKRQKTVITFLFATYFLNIIYVYSLFSAEFNNDTLTEYHDFNKVMFSSKIIDDSNIDNQLLVVKNDNAFIRESHKHSFSYAKVKNHCYQLENTCTVCIKDNKIYNIICNAEKKNAEMLTSLMIGDPFFNENNSGCNNMKFDVINNYFVNNQKITYAIYQLFLVGYYDVARIVLFRDDNNETKKNDYTDNTSDINDTLLNNTNISNMINKNSIKAFVISSKNDVSCSPYDKFLIYDHKSLAILEEEEKKNKNTNRERKIKKNQIRDDYKRIYGRIALSGYQHLQRYENLRDLNNIVIVLKNEMVTDINIVALEFKWRTMDGKSLISPYNFEYSMQKK